MILRLDGLQQLTDLLTQVNQVIISLSGKEEEIAIRERQVSEKEELLERREKQLEQNKQELVCSKISVILLTQSTLTELQKIDQTDPAQHLQEAVVRLEQADYRISILSYFQCIESVLRIIVRRNKKAIEKIENRRCYNAGDMLYRLKEIGLIPDFVIEDLMPNYTRWMKRLRDWLCIQPVLPSQYMLPLIR